YQWETGYGKQFISVVKADLTNPYLKVDMVMGAGSYTQKATVSQMANRTGAVALVNGDFFNTAAQGAPLGASIVDGKLATAPMNSIGFQALGIDKSNRAHIEQITFGGYATASNGKKYPIQGLNKAAYTDNITGAHSHDDTINLYNDLWTSKSRGRAGKECLELLLDGNGIVEEISTGKTLSYVVPKDKIIVQANGNAKKFIDENVKKGEKLVLDYKIRPEKDWQMMIGGHGLLVDKGAVLPYVLAPEAIDGQRARTAAGISADGKTIYLVAVEGRTNRSTGIKLKELAIFMQSIGCEKALNFDGGGSTAMSAKHTGELNPELVISPEKNGSERYVVNGLGIYNTAQEGPLHQI
ncbi:MAG: phosphodiester glycosidase family protein, partial [Gallicola sp.]|nr:phosphodiester glycosidase family protein [Gallicola sp.]